MRTRSRFCQRVLKVSTRDSEQNLTRLARAPCASAQTCRQWVQMDKRYLHHRSVNSRKKKKQQDAEHLQVDTPTPLTGHNASSNVQLPEASPDPSERKQDGSKSTPPADRDHTFVICSSGFTLCALAWTYYLKEKTVRIPESRIRALYGNETSRDNARRELMHSIVTLSMQDLGESML